MPRHFIVKIEEGGSFDQSVPAEISPCQSLKISKFISVAQSLPDIARDNFNLVYRAIDMYLEVKY